MQISLGGKRWTLVFKKVPEEGDYRGYCLAPDMKAKRIVVDKALTGEERLEVILHECLHAALWSIDESVIEGTAKDLAKILWRLGYSEGQS